MTIKSKLVAGLLAIGLAAPLALATPASAAPRHDDAMRGNHQVDAFHDRNHRPPMRTEHRPAMPRHGHYRWRDGSWAWRNGAWTWAPGLWIKF